MGLLPSPTPLALTLALLGCSPLRTQQERNGEPAPSGSSAPSTSVSPSPQAAAPASSRGVERPVSPSARQECLRSPLSPSAEELPFLQTHRHEVRGPRGELHSFRPTTMPLVDASRLEARVESLHARFPDVELASTGSCTAVQGLSNIEDDAQCIHIQVPICEPWLPSAQRLLPALEGLGLVVEIVGRFSPRCRGDACLPVAYHANTPVREDLVWSGAFTLPYRANGERTPLMSELGRGSCHGDGDCEVTGCGNHCEAWTEPPHGAHCPAFRQLADAHCGCVANACTWFVQPPLVEVKTEITVEGWQPADRHDARGLDKLSGDAVFRELLEGPWFRRQLERIKHERGVELPKEFELDLSLNHRLRVTKAGVTVEHRPGPPWLKDILKRLPVPVPNFSKEAPHPVKLVRVKGRVHTYSR